MTLIFNSIIIDGVGYEMNLEINGVTYSYMHQGPTPTAEDWSNFYHAVGLSGGGDPYINPIYGDRYKLPDNSSVYRLLDNNCIKERFFINIESDSLDETQSEILTDFMYKETKSKIKGVKNNEDIDIALKCLGLSFPKSAYFFKTIYINNNENSILFDLEKFIFINQYGAEINPDKSFQVKEIENKEKLKLNVGMYNDETPEKTYEINFYNTTYGNVKLHLFKFSNPQIRNGFNMICNKSINFLNSRGAILGNQELNNIVVNNIFCDKNIPEFKITDHKVTEEQINEIFMKDTYMILNKF